jgi:hypothetical protein
VTNQTRNAIPKASAGGPGRDDRGCGRELMRPGFGRTHTRGDLWAYHDASVPIDPPPDADGSNSEQHGHSGTSSIVQGRRHGLSIPALVIAASAIAALAGFLL